MEIKIDTPTLRKFMNHKVRYKGHYGNLWTQGIIEDVIKKQVCINGEYIPFSRIKTIELI